MIASNATLKLVNVFFRHGDRAPISDIELYPNDPHLHHNFDPPGYENLTKSGEMRTHKLGEVLRETYKDFLGTNINPMSIAARSTDFQRTKESLNNVLEELAPGIKVPVTVVPIKEDVTFIPIILTTFHKEFHKIQDMPEFKQKMASFDDLNKRLSILTGKDIVTARHINNIYMTLEVEKFMGLKLPEWSEDMYPDGELKEPASFLYEALHYTDVMKRLNGGTLIKLVIENMKAVTDSSMDKERKIMLYSGHDINIASLLIVMGVFYPHCPKFTSAVIFELHLINEVYYVKVLYYLGEPPETKELNIPGCEILCPLDQFINQMQSVMPPADLDVDQKLTDQCIIDKLQTIKE